MKKITREQITSEPVPCPPLAEQRRVAAGLAERLAGAEAVAAACRAERAAADALPTAYLRTAFPPTPERA